MVCRAWKEAWNDKNHAVSHRVPAAKVQNTGNTAGSDNSVEVSPAKAVAFTSFFAHNVYTCRLSA